MVTVDRLSIHGFGRFSGQRFALAPGLNIIFGGNEAGKSTIHSFIEAMLFGFWAPTFQHRELEPGYAKYRPWQGSLYGGELEYSWREGKVRVARDFAANTVAMYDANGTEIGKELPLNSWGEPDFARLHFGCSKLLFRNTISIRQLGSATEAAVAQEVRTLLKDLAESGGSGISVTAGLDLLGAARQQLSQELGQAQTQLSETRQCLAAAEERVKAAADLEFRQYKVAARLEALTIERQRLKEQEATARGQAAQTKLERLAAIKQEQQAAEKELERLGEASLSPSQHRQWQDLQAQAARAKENAALQTEAVAEAARQQQACERALAELAAYAEHSQDTLIEMSSAWQIQTKGRQIIEDMEADLHQLNEEIRRNTAELSSLPYFRPGTLEQAKTLQAMAAGREIRDSRTELEQELARQERSHNSSKLLAWLVLLALPAVAALAYWLEPLTGLLAVPLLTGLFLIVKSLRASRAECRSIRRDIYSLELQFVNDQRAREHAQRELRAFWASQGVADMSELEEKYRRFTALHERNYQLQSEQKFIASKLEEYYRETEAKANDLRAVLASVGLDGLPLEQALAEFRVKLDRMLESRTLLAQSADRHRAAQERLAVAKEQATAVEGQLAGQLRTFAVTDPDGIETLAAKTVRRQELHQEIAELEQRLADVLAGTSEAELRAAAKSAYPGDAPEPHKLAEALERKEAEMLSLQGEKSEIFGRLEALYASLPSPPELAEQCWQHEARCQELADSLAACDLALTTLTRLSQDLKNQIAPELNQMVSKLVAQITGGKYEDLQVAPDMSISVALPETGRQVPLEKLSGGTIDQLYFSTRVAIADLVTGGQLPLFLDDSFVLYDDLRLERMLRLLLQLSERRQIILLTCQQRESEQLSRLAPEGFHMISLAE